MKSTNARPARDRTERTGASAMATATVDGGPRVAPLSWEAASMPICSSSAACRKASAPGKARSGVKAAALLALILSGCSDEPEASQEVQTVEIPLDATDHPVVYMSDDEADGPYDLWLMKEDGSDPQRLTPSPGPRRARTGHPTARGSRMQEPRRMTPTTSTSSTA